MTELNPDELYLRGLVKNLENAGFDYDAVQLESLIPRMISAMEEYSTLKESYLERVSTANKIIIEKIEKIRHLRQGIEKCICMLNSVQNDFNIDQVYDLREELQKLKGDSTS